MSKNVTLKSPSNEEAVNILKGGFKDHRSIIIVGSCSINYKGRASSQLGEGERIIILKPDGSALIHRPKDYPPVNWQPPGSLFRIKLDNDSIGLRIFRKKENEVIEVKIRSIILLAVLDLKDVAEFNLYASEKDMQEAILIQPSLIEDNFRPITSERHVEPGFIDVMGYDKKNVLTIIEIKRKKATKKDVMQLKKYIDSLNVGEKRNIRGIMVAPDLVKGSQELMSSFGYEFKLVTPQQCSEILLKKKSKVITDYFNVK